MREISLHLLDIAENSVTAGARKVEITVIEDSTTDLLRVRVADDGRGMDADLLARIGDPFATTRTTRKVGLGIPFLKAAAEACDGGLQITSSPGSGTCIEAEFHRSHVDRMPLGDLAGTVLSLVVGFPQVHWLFCYQVDGQTFTFDDAPVKEVLGDVPLSDPGVLACLRTMLEEGIRSLQGADIQQRGKAEETICRQ